MIKKIKNILRPYRWLYHMLSNRKMLADELWAARWSFSQFGEDLVLDNLLTRNKIEKGFYIEVGAYDPFIYSNTYFFYKKGWNGICIEPNPVAAEKLKIKRPNDIILNTAISNHRSVAKFALSKSCSGILDQNYTFRNQKHEEIIDVKCVPLSDIIEQYAINKSIDFLSIDCEGHDLTILQTAAWNKARPKIVLVEDHNISYDGPIYEFMKSIRYSYICKIGPTIFFKEDNFLLKVH